MPRYLTFADSEFTLVIPSPLTHFPLDISDSITPRVAVVIVISGGSSALIVSEKLSNAALLA